MKKIPLVLAVLISLGTVSPFSFAQMNHDNQENHENHNVQHTKAAKDTRIAVKFPAPIREKTLAQMRDHLLAISEIQELLAKRDFDGAGKLAEQRLGMSSMQSHGAHESAPYMPAGMRELGGSMHRAASRFATASQDAAVSDKVEPALAALSEVTRACVACHTKYKAK